MHVLGRITIGLLALALVLATGLGAHAHAPAGLCMGQSCDAHALASPQQSHFGHTVTHEESDEPSREQYSECCELLCNGSVVFGLEAIEVRHQLLTLATWPVLSLSALEAPDGLERPPKL